MSLRQYHQKRNFTKTSEPKGKVLSGRSHLFVIQKHAASHLHYDFRLEMDGVLKSWAVPKGPSLDPKIKRLAIHVEDHPIEYGDFEGIIPQGQYGGGTVMLWDRGEWASLDDNPHAAYVKGHLRFHLYGKKLHGRWDLIHFKDKHWFLIKHQDNYAKNQEDYDVLEVLDKSVLTKKNIAEIAKPNVDLAPYDLLPAPFPQFIAPQLATLVNKPPEHGEWLHEIKFDGYRILTFKKGRKTILKSRNGKDWTSAFPSIATAIQSLPFKNVILDGEIVVLDEEGRSNFQLLQNAIDKQEQPHFIYFIFDILYLNKYDLRELTLLQRKWILQQLLKQSSPILQFSNHMLENGYELFEYACQQDLEGIISKKIQSPYISERSKDWLKIKCHQRQEFVIGGYTSPKGQREYFGSLLLGVYNREGTLNYAGNVGTGFNKETFPVVYQLLKAHAAQNNPFNISPPGYKTAHWVLPKIICEVKFTEWTQGGHLRHPSFQGLRLDKKAKEVVREKAVTVKKIQHKTRPEKIVHSQPTLSHPNKILYPEDGITKADLLHYYQSIQDYILPYLLYRPLTLKRCPNHYQTCFYQRHLGESTYSGLYEIEGYLYLKDEKGLFNLVQMGTLEIHPWGSTVQHLEKPDVIVFDLDPAPDVSWTDVVEAALDIRHYLTQYQLTSFIKTTGGKGLHIVIPIEPEYDWESIKSFTHIFVQTLEKIKPREYVSKMSKSKRKGKIFIDYLRNQRSATAIAPYSPRARIHAPVATPLSWDELSTHIEDNTYTVKTLPRRLHDLKKDPWKEFWNIKNRLDIS